MARIRSKSAVVDFGKLRLSGFIAWLLWGLVQVYWSFFRNRGRRDNGWLRSYMTVERVARLIASQTHLRTDGTAATAARGTNVSGAWEIVAGHDRFSSAGACDGSPAGCREWRSTP
jgi:NADH dehydrogenase